MKKLHALLLGAAVAVQPGSLEASRPVGEAVSPQVVGGMHVRQESRRALDGRVYRASDHGTLPIPSAQRARQTKAPVMRVTPKGAPIYGYLGYQSTETFEPGMYEISPESRTLLWEDHLYEEYDGITMVSGWMRKGVLYGSAQSVTPYGITAAANLEVDLLTGNLIMIEQIADNSTPYFAIAAYRDTEDAVYGLYRDTDGYFSFGKGTYDKVTDVLSITPVRQHCEDDLYLTSLTYCPDDDTLYGVLRIEDGEDYRSEFVSVSTDGVPTKICDIKLGLDLPLGPYFSGLVWSPADGLFYWNANFYDMEETTALYSFDPTTKEFKLLEIYDNSDQFVFMLTTDGRRNPAAPGRPTLKGLDFPGGSTSGTVTYVMPSTLEDGSPAPASLSWEATAGDLRQTGTATPGAEVTVRYDNLPEGHNTFGIVASAGDNRGFSLSHSAYIGQDTPLPPANVVLTEKSLTWDPVTEGINGGYVDKDGMTYIVYDRNRDRVATVTDTSYAVAISDEDPLEAHVYYVAASYGKGHVSTETQSNTLVAGKPYDLPAEWAPTSEESELFTTAVGAGSESATWTYIQNPDRFACGWNPNGPCDVWLFTPPFKVADADRYYSVTFDARIGNPTYPEELLTVWAGTSASPEKMTEVVIDEFTPADDYAQCHGVFRLPAGTGVIGFHCTSPAGQDGVIIREITVSDDNITDRSPASPGDISVKAFDKGELKATVTFTLPKKLLDGTEIPAATEISAKAVSSAGETSASGKPGEKISVAVPTVQGLNTISVSCSIGAANSIPATVEVYTGVAIPVAVSNLRHTVADDMMNVRLEWDPVTTGELGGYVDPEGVSYDVYRVFRSMFGDMNLELIESGVKGTVYDWEIPEETPQDYFTIGVVATNEAGSSAKVTSFSAVLGTPYTVDCGESFRDIDPADPFAMKPYVVLSQTTNNCNYRVESPASFDSSLPDLTGSYFCFFIPEGMEGYGAMSLPRFSTMNLKSCTVELTALTGSRYYAPIVAWARCPGMSDAIKLGTVGHPNPGDHSNEFTLPNEMLNKPWVQIEVHANLTPEKWVMAFRGWKAKGKSSVDSLNSGSLLVSGGNGTLTVSGTDGKPVDVYATDGRRVATSKGDTRFRLPAGIYIVRAGGSTVKTAVR